MFKKRNCCIKPQRPCVNFCGTNPNLPRVIFPSSAVLVPGPTGPSGCADSLKISSVSLSDNPNEFAVIDKTGSPNHELEIIIPRGERGEKGDVGEKGDKGDKGEKGDIGETGPIGEAEKIAIVAVEAVDEAAPAEVDDDYANLTHNLTFKIPRGPSGLKGDKGDKGDPGERGEAGPTGENGPRGNSMVYGHFTTTYYPNTATYVDINKTNFPYNENDLSVGDVVITHNAVIGSVLQVDRDNNRIMLRPMAEIKGEKGDKGDTGPTGPELIKTSLVLGYNNDPFGFPAEGMVIKSGERIPFVRVETNLGELVSLNPDYSIQFAETGVYSVNFITNAYVKLAGDTYNPQTDFVVVGFREENTDNIFAAANCWTANECATTMSGQGVFVVDDISKKYELVNLQKREIYVNAVDITKTITNSYFASVLASLVFHKLTEKTD